jgi:hypothetical protein
VGALRHYAGHPEDVSGVHKVLLPFVAERLRLQARLIPDQGLRGFTLPASLGRELKARELPFEQPAPASSASRNGSKTRHKLCDCRMGRPASHALVAIVRTAEELPGGDIFLDLLSKDCSESERQRLRGSNHKAPSPLSHWIGLCINPVFAWPE